MPILRDYEVIQGTPFPKDAAAKALAYPGRVKANQQIELIRTALLLEEK